MVVLSAGNQRQAKVCFWRTRIHVCRFGQKARRFRVAIQVVKRNPQIVENLKLWGVSSFTRPNSLAARSYCLFSASTVARVNNGLASEPEARSTKSAAVSASCLRPA